MTEPTDNELVDNALNGDKKALEDLIRRHQTYVYNVALTYTANADDAADLMQEVLIKMVTKLASYKGKSAFRTWLYRILKNHFLNAKRGREEDPNLTFTVFGKGLDRTPDSTLNQFAWEVEEKLLVEEAKLSCMKGMLLCLDREQRLIYILGELFEFPDTVGAEVMELSRENFRVKLHRTKKQLYSFMHEKCGLINAANPCRCARKTAGFIKAGYVDPNALHFQRGRVSTIEETVPEKLNQFTHDVMRQYRKLYRQHPYLKGPAALEKVQALLDSEAIKKTFDLN